MEAYNRSKQARQLPRPKRNCGKASKSMNKSRLVQSKSIVNESAVVLPSIFRRPIKECANLYDKTLVDSEEELSEEKLWESYFSKEEMESACNAAKEDEADSSFDESEENQIGTLKPLSTVVQEPISKLTLKKEMKPLNCSILNEVKQSAPGAVERQERMPCIPRYMQMRNLLLKRANRTRQHLASIGKSISCKPTFRNKTRTDTKQPINSTTILKSPMIAKSRDLNFVEEKNKEESKRRDVITINIRSLNLSGLNAEERKEVSSGIHVDPNVITFMPSRDEDTVYNRAVKPRFTRRKLCQKSNPVNSIVINANKEEANSTLNNLKSFIDHI
eukprot:TRINITY_DN944_c0_g1_i2.p1 TRINITY_DN944_c0_g1~~TRINITY_DN944_c0_g1_i2.p1  ORF type:complete len:332 (+),score=74.52 TRINITY_DN944_c0_g1_i2:167-1162(+)